MITISVVYRSFFVVFMTLSLVVPNLVTAGYGDAYACGYGEGTYYAQSTYYTQSTYQTTFSNTVNVGSNFTVLGAISKGSGTFVIDHPLDPENKLLYHSFVESPDAKNIYDGVATLDQFGEATVELPSYFEALNGEYRYQLRPLGASAPDLFLKSKIKDNRFTIAGGVPNGRASWQVSGIRRDPYILAHPIVPEVTKGSDTLVPQGEYLHPELYPEEEGKTIYRIAWDYLRSLFR